MAEPVPIAGVRSPSPLDALIPLITLARLSVDHGFTGFKVVKTASSVDMGDAP